MKAARLLTLLPALAGFAALSVALITHPAWSPGAFPLYGLLFLWLGRRGDEEAPVLLLFLVSLLGLYLLTRLPYFTDIVAVLLEMGALWVLLYGLAVHHFHQDQAAKEAGRELSRLETETRDREREIAYYAKRRDAMEHQAVLRRGFARAARQLGSASDPEETRRRLLDILGQNYPQAQIRIAIGHAKDPVEEWAGSKRAPVLVEDLRSDRRFKALAGAAFRSAVVAPVLVLREPVGFVRLESSADRAFDPGDLRAVDLFTTLASLSIESAHLFEQARLLAVHDGLTRLYTHRAFQARLQEELLRAARGRSDVSLVLGDIDHFKSFNDTLGHQAGDQVLKDVAARWQALAREVDLVARYGGEEFVMVLPGVGAADAARIAEELRGRIETQPLLLGSRRTNVTMSFGVATFPQDAITPSQLVRAADERLYRAKKSGRNRVVTG